MVEASLPRQSSFSNLLDRPLWSALALDWEKALYAVLIALAIVTRFYNLGERVISHDESLHTYYSWELSKGKGFVHTPLMHGPLQFHALALSYTLFGASDFTARIPAAVCGVIAVGLMYFFRRWLGRAGALLAALFFLISPYLLYYTRYSREDPYTLVWQLLMALSLFYYMDTKEDKYLYLMAATTSLLYATKEISFFNVAIWLLFLGFIYLRDMFTAQWPEGRQKWWFGVTLAGAAVAAVLSGFFFWYGRHSAWAIENAPIVVSGDIATSSASNPYLTAMGIALGVVIVFLIVATLISVAVFREKMRDYASVNMMIVLITFALPQLTAVPVKLLLKADPLDYSYGGLLKTATVFVPLFVLSAGIGLFWDWKKWLIASGVFYGIYVPLFTTMFTNGGGFATGMVGSLGYWLDQQDVQRGSQPWYFYLLLQVPVYEFLPAIGSMLAAGLGIWRWVMVDADSDDDSAGTPTPTPAKFPALVFIGYWILLAFSMYSYAGEKMPWLTVHMTLPMGLLAAWAFGQIVEAVDWQNFRANSGWIALLVAPLTIYGVLFAIFKWLGATPPFQGNELNQLQATMSFLMAMAVSIGGGVGMYFVGRSLGWKQLGVITAMLAGVGLVFLTARAAFYANYINFDNQTEFINYASGAPGVKVVMAQVEEISKRTTDGMGIRVAYDDDVSWPVTWYMRDFTGQVFYGDQPTREAFQDTPLIIAGDNNWSKVEPLLGNRYYSFEYIRMWWPMQEYFGLDKENGGERLLNAIKDPQYREAIFRVWFFRDYTKYGELTSVDYSLSRWPVADRMRFYIRKDVAAQLWPLGIGPEAVKDPYAESKLLLTADVIWGLPGTGEGEFTAPRAVAAAPDGSVYVADTGGHRIEKFSADGQFITAWGSFGSIESNTAMGGTFNEIWGLAVDSDGFVYAADTWNHRIQKFTPDGEFVTTWGVFGLTDAGLNAMWGPRGIAVDGGGNVYVADTGNKRILVFDREGNPLRQIGSGGALDGELDEPVGVAVSNDGRLFVADTWNQRVQVFTTDGAFLGKWDVSGWEGQSLDNKPYIAIDNQNRVYITDPKGYRVIVFADNGLFQHTFGDFGGDSTTFDLPSGLAVGDGWLYVADTNNSRVMRFAVEADGPSVP
ncbi:MAG: TIGR03663 family protein [Chloroflexi bacterium]|nr:TIGR03663 family protein [Chloroflexota bacterium]